MMQRRLHWLLAVLGALVILRILVPPQRAEPPALAEALVRKPLAPTPKDPIAPVSAAPAPRLTATLREPDDRDVPGNAFAVRPPPAPPYVPAAAPVIVAKAKAAAPPPVVAPVFMEPPPPPVPFAVIGTWDDGKEPGVFLSGPNGTLLARTGVTLQSEYKVTAVTPQQVSLIHIASKREIRLPVPSVSPSPQQRP